MHSPNPSRHLARGPFLAGLREVVLPGRTSPDDAPLERSLPTSIWYPARPNPGAAGSLVEDAPHLLGQPHRAILDLPPNPAPAPLIVFSHGHNGSRHQSTFLMTHLASWGFVVAAPDHVGNTFLDAAERTEPDEMRQAHREARAHRPVDLLSVLEALAGRGVEPSPPRPLLPSLPPIDSNRLGALGHSFGGWTVLKLAGLDQRLRAIGCLAPAAEPFVSRVAFEPGELPLPSHMETLVLGGREDVLVDLETDMIPLHKRLGEHARLEVIDGFDHFHYCDGIPLLQQMHVNAPRPGQLQSARPYTELCDEKKAHEIVCARVGDLFDHALRGDERDFA